MFKQNFENFFINFNLFFDYEDILNKKLILIEEKIKNASYFNLKWKKIKVDYFYNINNFVNILLEKKINFYLFL